MNYKIVIDQKKLNVLQWTDFVKGHPNGNIFQTPSMYFALAKSKLIEPFLVAILDQNDQLLGIMVAQIQKQYDGYLGRYTSKGLR